jgi:CII-binding regulator of phage lambda lysogenization HflD
MTTDPLLREKFYLNKAIVCSKLNLYLEYGENINQVLKLNPTGQKAVYHQIKQLILTGKFKEASEAIKDKSSVLGEANTKELLKMLELERSFRMNKIDWYKALKF